jgi:hypothetical protein
MYPESTKAGGAHMTAGPLDTCLAPAPGGPIPIPYANMVDGLASSGDKAGRNTQKVMIAQVAGANPWVGTATAAALVGRTRGDDSGSAGGIVTSTSAPSTRMLQSTSSPASNSPGATLTPSQTKLMIME